MQLKRAASSVIISDTRVARSTVTTQVYRFTTTASKQQFRAWSCELCSAGKLVLKTENVLKLQNLKSPTFRIFTVLFVAQCDRPTDHV